MSLHYRITRRNPRVPARGMSIDDLLNAHTGEGGSMMLYSREDWVQHFLAPLHQSDDRAVASFHSLPAMHALMSMCRDIVWYGMLVEMRGEDPSAVAQAAAELPRIIRPRNTAVHHSMYHWMESNVKEAVRRLWTVGKVRLRPGYTDR